MAANDNKICANFIRQCVDLGFGSAEYQVSVVLSNIQGRGEISEMSFGCVLNLLLNCREIHRDIATVSQRQRFNNMNAAEFCIEGCA